MIAGPGSIASAMLWVSRADTTIDVVVVLAAITAVMLITLVTLLASGALMRLICGEQCFEAYRAHLWAGAQTMLYAAE